MQLGTTFANWVAKPIARGIDGTFGTDLENCSACKKREQWLNNFSGTVVDWLTNKKGDKMADEEKNEKVEYLLQVSVIAVDLREAVSVIQGGKIVSAGPMPKMGTIQPGARPIPRVGAGQPPVAQATSGGPTNKGGS